MKKKIYLLLLMIAVGSCNRTNEQAADYLRRLGYKDVACSSQVGGVAVCAAANQHFRCVMTDFQGCRPRNDVACEKFYTERPAP